MKIAYNPKTAAALTTAPANNDITFDLSGLSIYVKGIRFKGTDTTYSVFKKHGSSGGGYDGLVPVPDYNNDSKNRFLKEDGTWTDDYVTLTTVLYITGKKTISSLMDITNGDVNDDNSLYIRPVIYMDDSKNMIYSDTKANTIIRGSSIKFQLSNESDSLLLDTSSLKSSLPIVSTLSITGTTLVSTTTDAAPLTVSSNILVSNLNADLLDGVHYQNILERDYSGNSFKYTENNQNSISGWFRIGETTSSNGRGTSFILSLTRSYGTNSNETYAFSISIAYNGSINITQLSGYANSRLITKIRIDWQVNKIAYIDIYITESALNNYFWTTIGQAKSYTTWIVNPTLQGTAYEFATVNGTKSDKGFIGDLSGNATSASSLICKRLDSTTLNNTSGSFVFDGLDGPWPDTDWAGLQVQGQYDKWQITANADTLLFRQNDDNNASPTSWSNWYRLARTIDNVASATKLQTARTLWGLSFDGTANVSGNMSSVGQITFSALSGTNGRALLYQQMADNDYFRIYVGGTASNSGYAEIATADDGNEPIYVRQYTGVYSTVKRTLTLLDSDGNSNFPGNITTKNIYGAAGSFSSVISSGDIDTNARFQSNGSNSRGSYPNIRFHIPGINWAQILMNGSGQVEFRGGAALDSSCIPVIAGAFVKDGSSDNYVLLGGGGHKSISSFLDTYDGRYVNVTGDTMTGELINQSGGIWVQGGSAAGGNVGRMTLVSGMPNGLAYNTSKRGVRIYSNAIAFADPYNGNTNNDAGWIRHIEETANNGTLEIATGDDNMESIVVRRYNTSSQIGKELYLLNSAGNSTFPGTLTATKFISNITTGTAPLSVSSTTVCANLNADFIDGFHINSIAGGNLLANHGSLGTSYTPDTYSSTFVNKSFAAFAERGSWAYAYNGYVTTDTGVNIPLAGTAVFQWGASDTNKTLLFITPYDNSGVSNPAANEMLFYTSNGSGYTSAWTRVLTHRNYTTYTVTKTGGGASGTWGINITGSANNLVTLTRETRYAWKSNNTKLGDYTGFVTDNQSYLEIRGFCPPTMYRTSHDRPAPFGLGFGNGSESGGIMPIGQGDKLQEIMFYGANSGPTIFTWKRQLWEGTNQLSTTSNYYSATMMSLDSSNGNLYVRGTVNSGPLTVNGNISLNNVGSINNIAIGGGIYWNPYVESSTDGTDAASITLLSSGGPSGGTTLRISQLNDWNDTIQFSTNASSSLYHNDKKIATLYNTYVSGGKGYLFSTEITQVNNADTLDGYHESSFCKQSVLGWYSDYTYYVVGLCQITDYTVNGNNASGTISVGRDNGIYNRSLIHYSIQTVYNTTNIYFNYSYLGLGLFEPCTFTYNSKKWAGFVFRAGTASTDNVIIQNHYSSRNTNAFFVHYYNTRNGVLNAEINSSLSINGSDITIGSMTIGGNMYAAHFYENSDIRYKRVLNNLTASSRQLASLPLFDFEWIDGNILGTGTSALEVQKILPNIVDGEEKLTLDYGVLGTISGVVACREIEEIKPEIEVLKLRIKELENQLNKH